jgi:hypothetical protein
MGLTYEIGPGHKAPTYKLLNGLQFHRETRDLTDPSG